MSESQRERLDELVQEHQRRLYGFLRCRTNDDAAANDLVQRTWLEVWRRFDSFDESKGSFWTFTKIWAGIVAKRHWEERSAEPLATETEEDGTIVPGEAGLPASARAEGTVDDEAAIHVEEEIDAAQVLLELLCRIAASTRPPHEIVTFLYSRLKWKPAEIVDELAPRRLDDLLDRVEAEYARLSRFQRLEHVFCPLRGRMTFALGATLYDPRTRKLYDPIAERIAAEIILREFFVTEEKPPVLVTRWWDSLKRAVFNDIRSSGRGELIAAAAA